MKRLFAILVILSVVFSVCGCSKADNGTSVSKDADITLTFVYGDKDIHVTLEDEEADKVIDILDGNEYAPRSAGTPSCGFDENISLTADGRVFAIACDDCNCIQDLGNQRYFDISDENMDYIRSLFENNGGHFPCV